MLYIKKYEKEEVKFLSATDEEIINHVMNNSELMDFLHSKIESKNYNEWLNEVFSNYVYVACCTKEEAIEEIESSGEAEVLYKNGMTVQEATIELLLSIGRSIHQD